MYMYVCYSYNRKTGISCKSLVLACIPKISGNFESFSVSDKKLLSLISSKCSMLHSCACAYRYAESSYIRCTIQACDTPVYIIMFSSVSVDIDNRNKKLFKMNSFLLFFFFLDVYTWWLKLVRVYYTQCKNCSANYMCNALGFFFFLNCNTHAREKGGVGSVAFICICV